MLTKAMTSAQSAAPIVSDSSTHPGQLLVTGFVNAPSDFGSAQLVGNAQLVQGNVVTPDLSEGFRKLQHVVQYFQAKVAEFQNSQ